MTRMWTVRDAGKLLVALALPLAVGGLSGLATARGVASWYPTLEKPWFNPPAWVFGPVWTVLYLLMGVASFFVWRKGLASPRVRTALVVFAVQLVLNGLWSLLFFGMQSPGWALVEIVLLWCSIVVTIRLFWGLVPTAGALLVPYGVWVSFAAILNGSLWWLNRSSGG